MKEIIKNNRVTISGEIVSDFSFSHEVFGEKFYTADLSVFRTSGVADIILLMVSGRLLDMSYDWKGQFVQIEGQFRSFNKREENRNRLILSVFAREAEVLEGRYDSNHILLDGYICKTPMYRTTPLDREIADLIVAVNRPYGKADYIPCVVWGRNARFAGKLVVGTHICVEGRIQSREYQKRISDTETETKIAYEVSARKINVIEETEE